MLEDRFIATFEPTTALLKAGYHGTEASECQKGKIVAELPRTQTSSYPHAILDDFKSCWYKNQRTEPTPMLTFENAHVLISVSVGDTLNRSLRTSVENTPRSCLASSWKSCNGAEKTLNQSCGRSSCQKTLGGSQKHSA